MVLMNWFDARVLAASGSHYGSTVYSSGTRTSSYCTSAALAFLAEEGWWLLHPCRCGDLSPEELQVLTAVMLLKQRGPEAVQWHSHWRQHAAAESAAQEAGLQSVLGCC